MARIDLPSAAQALVDSWKHLDRNDDQILTKNEHRQVLVDEWANARPPAGMDRAEFLRRRGAFADNIFDRMDLNQDSKVTVSEFSFEFFSEIGPDA